MNNFINGIPALSAAALRDFSRRWKRRPARRGRDGRHAVLYGHQERL